MTGETLQNEASAGRQKLGPLVLLHVTLLQAREAEYTDALLSEVLPQKELSVYKSARATLLQKLGPVVRQRGILLRHPRNDFNELLEKVLASLDLDNEFEASSDNYDDDRGPEQHMEHTGRQCHDTEERVDEDSDDTACESFCPTPDLSRRSGNRPRICSTCGRPRRFLRVRDNAASDRYDIKVYAANGLVGFQVWEAVWHEMERVDVEINVRLLGKWRERLNERKREIEKQAEDEAMANDLFEKDKSWSEGEEIAQQVLNTSDLPVRPDRQRSHENSVNNETFMPGHRLRMERQRNEQHLAGLVREEVDLKTPSCPRLKKRGSTIKRSASCEKLFQMFEDPIQTTRTQTSQLQIPLSDLIRNCMWLLAQDTRNVVILALGLATIILLMSTTSTSSQQMAIAENQLSNHSSFSDDQGIALPTLESAKAIVKSREEEQGTETPLAPTSTAGTENIPLSIIQEQELTIESSIAEMLESGSCQRQDDWSLEPPEPPEP